MQQVNGFEPPLKNQSNEAYLNPNLTVELVKVEKFDVTTLLETAEAQG